MADKIDFFKGQNNIHQASYDGDLEAVITYIEAGVDPDTRDEFGGTALHTAMFQDNIEVVKALLEAGCDVNAQGSNMCIGAILALHSAKYCSDIEKIRSDISETLSSTGLNGDCDGAANGYTPLHDAVWTKNKPAVRLLLEHGADTSIKGNDGQTPSEKARANGDIELADLIDNWQKR